MSPSFVTYSRGLLASLVLSASLLAATWVRPVHAAPSVVIVQPNAEGAIDRAIVMRLVQLELSDVEIPAPPEAPPRAPPPLFVRIFSDKGQLTIELWDRGELQGQRHLSLQGSAALLARRTALVCGDMAEHLREKRRIEVRNFKRQQARLAKQNQSAPITLRLSPTLWPEMTAQYWAEPHGFALGPRLSAGLRGALGADLLLFTSALSTRVAELEQAPWIQWYEAGLRPGYGLRTGTFSNLRLGVYASVAIVHSGEAQFATRDSVRSRETWSARAGIDAAWRWRVSSHFELSTGLELGTLLRRVQLEQAPNSHADLGGVTLGASVGITAF
jgi:hypothetical protein